MQLSDCSANNWMYRTEQNGTAKMPRILAVDDNDDNLLLVSYILEFLNCKVLTAADGLTAISMAHTYKPDLILLDIIMPHLDGVGVMNHLRQEPVTTRIPVVAVTALARTEDKERFLSAGFNDYISKPYILEDLENIICRHLSWSPSLFAPAEVRLNYAI